MYLVESIPFDIQEFKAEENPLSAGLSVIISPVSVVEEDTDVNLDSSFDFEALKGNLELS